MRALIAVLLLTGCTSGGTSHAPYIPPPEFVDIKYDVTETVMIFNSGNTMADQQHFTNVYHRVLDCMGYDEPIYLPAIFVVESTGCEPGSRGCTIYTGQDNVWIEVRTDRLVDNTVSHEFIHYILFSVDNDLSIYNMEHKSEYFKECVL